MEFNYKGIERAQFHEIVDSAVNRLEEMMARLELSPQNEDLDALYMHMLFTHHKMMEGFFGTKDYKILEQAERVQTIINRLQIIKNNATAM